MLQATVDIVAMLAGCLLVVALIVARQRMPAVLGPAVEVIAGGTAIWAVSAGATALVSTKSQVIALAGLQILGSWSVVVGVLWLGVLVSYRGHLLSRTMLFLAVLPAAVMESFLLSPDLQPLVVAEVMQSDTAVWVVWGPVFWYFAVGAALVISAVSVIGIYVVATTIAGQRRLAALVMLSTVPAGVAWAFFMADHGGQQLVSIPPLLLCGAVFFWLTAAVRHTKLAQLPITVSRVLQEVEDGVIVLAASGEVLQTNAAGRAFLYPDHNPHESCSAVTSGKFYQGQLPPPGQAAAVQTEDHRVVELMVTPLTVPGRTPSTVVSVRDITELARLREHLSDLASRDPMTGSRNRRYLETQLQDALNMVPVPRLTLVMFDVDRFKAVNDTYGHGMGDRVLTGISEEITKGLPPGAELIRMGGDEFAIILNNMDGYTAAKTAERLAGRCADLNFVGRHDAVSVTLSFGVHELVPGMDADQLLTATDRELYRAKRSRRQRGPITMPIPRAATHDQPNQHTT